MTPNPQQLSATSRLFSPTVFREMAVRGRSPAFSRLFKLSGLFGVGVCGEHDTVKEGFEAAFKVLARIGLRDDYVYRAAIAEKVLLGKHSLNMASMLSEFRAGGSKADVVILNGTAEVYEIKSDRDSLSRLEDQVSDYEKVFASVNVITSEKHIDNVMQMVPGDTGIMCLTSRFQIEMVRDARDRPDRISPVTVLGSLRVNEAKMILEMLGEPFPDIPNTMQYAVLREIFAKQDPASVHRAMVATLKETRSLAALKNFIGRLPRSLHARALSARINRSGHGRLVEAVSTPLSEAALWSAV